eukprot:gene10706-11851_t
MAELAERPRNRRNDLGTSAEQAAPTTEQCEDAQMDAGDFARWTFICDNGEHEGHSPGHRGHGKEFRFMLSAAPLGPKSIYMQNVVSLKVRHLANTIIVNTHDDLWKVREALKESSLLDCQIIVFDFKVPRYNEAERYPDLVDCPDTVANVFLDYAN